MIDRRFVRAGGACALLLVSVSLPAMASAQVAGEVAAPERSMTDDNGVDVATGRYRGASNDLVVGSGPGALTGTRIYGRPVTQDARIQLYNPYGSSSEIVVGTGEKTYRFTRVGSEFRTASDGARLFNSNGTYLLFFPDGTRYTYGHIEHASRHQNGSVSTYDAYAYLSEIRRPDGLLTTMTWQTGTYCPYGGTYIDEGIMNCRTQYPTSSGPSPQIWITRLVSISNSAGYRIDYSYAGSYLGGMRVPTQAEIASWKRLTGAQGGNSQGGSGPLPSVAYASTTTSISGGYVTTADVTDGLNRTTRYTTQFGSAGNYQAVRRPGSTVDNERVNLDANGRVSTIVRDGATWAYAYAQPSTTTSTLAVTDPTGRIRKYESNLIVSLPTRVEDEYGRVTSYTYDADNRLKTGTTPGGQVTTYAYNDRGNVTATTVTAPGGVTVSSSATYQDYSCFGPTPCNLMATSTDQRGVIKTYAYNSPHFGVTSVVTQNPGGNNPSTETRYVQVAGVWLPQRSWTCRTQVSCENAADAVQATTQYNANLLPASVTQGSGDGSVQATSTMTYTAAGDVLTLDGPLPGSADTTRYYYDAARQPLGMVGPDPDGGGSLARRASRASYDSWGRPTQVSLGTAADQGDTALANMSVLQTSAVLLDDAGRSVSTTLTAGGTVFSRVDRRYDAAGRPICVAQRMSPSALGNAGDACTVGSDAGFGPDRVTQITYSPAGVGNPASTSVTSAFGTAAASTETVLQTANGSPRTVTDGNGNVTTYDYDAFGRPSRTTFPGGSYEEVGYDGKGDAVTRRLRDGNTVGYGYDHLGRIVTANRPLGSYWETNKGYGWNLIGQLTTAADSNGRSLGFGYDALGRRTSQSDNWYTQGNASMQYDAGGRRTRLTYGDGFFVTYDYLVTGEMTAIRENGGFVLAGFAYDNLGRRASLTRGNGTVTGYGYDAGSRLTALTLDLAGGAQDQSVTLGYNPAGQIVSRTGSNDAYAWAGAVNADRAYGVNGLNQYTQAGAVTFGYDARGNLNNSGGTTYGYTLDNMLATGPGAALAYDPIGRLFNIAGGPVNTTLTYDGTDLLAETNQNGGALLRRYVNGPGTDEPLVWYEGGQRRYLHADERGSVVAVTNDAGSAITINTYDEFGIPGSGNQGRFQYTGQKWISELGVYDYKARMYSPTLGRFMQTDPIGYAAGFNMYNYVGGDPINMIDPSGLVQTPFQNCVKVPGLPTSSNGNEVIVTGGREVCTTIWIDIPDPAQRDWPGLAPSGRSPAVGAGVPQKEPYYLTDYDCSWGAGMLARAAGNAAVDAGGYPTAIGGTGAAAGTALGVYGAATGNIPAAGVGALATAIFTPVAAAGATIQGVGAVVAFAGGESSRSLVKNASAAVINRIPAPDWLKSGLKFAAKGLADRVPDVRTCRSGH